MPGKLFESSFRTRREKTRVLADFIQVRYASWLLN